jgi:RNA polymerase sigma-70 factor (ECF subfamily)
VSREELYAEGRRQWPALAECRDAFDVLVTDDSLLLHAGDLYLAAACAAGHADALQQFRDRYDNSLRAILGSLGLPDDVRQEARQRLEMRLFVATETAPASIRSYHARGTLLAFLRVAVVRQAQELVRKRHGRVEVDDDVLDEMPASTHDPELAYLKKLYREEFNRAFTTAVATLDARDRTLLRYSLVDGVTIDRLAEMYGIHRSTAARQVAKAREALVRSTQDELRNALSVDVETLDSILRLVESSADVSARRLLVSE